MLSLKQAPKYITSSLLFSWGLFFILFPLFIFTGTTEAYVLPKQILLAVITLLSLLAIGVQALVEKRVKVRSTVFDLPIAIFLVALFISSLFSLSRIDSLTAFVPYLLVGLSYFIITNTVKSEENALFFLSALIIGSTATAVIAIFSFLKIYLLPFAFAQAPGFTTLGSVFDQAVFFAGVLPLAIALSLPIIRGKANGKAILYAGATGVITIGLVVTVYQLFTTQRPIILPLGAGFQIAFAAISQDAPRIAQGFFFGSGIGTFFTDFTRFKQITFNANQSLWFLNFGQSSSFVLELLATTGVIGIFSFFFIIIKALINSGKKLANPVFFSMIALVLGAFVIPFSFTSAALFFFILGLFASIEGLKHPEKSFDLEFFLVTLRKSLFSYTPEEKPAHAASTSRIMPAALFIIILLIVGTVGYYATKYTVSDMLFAQSLVAASKNQGSETYQKQAQAISIFPYRESFYRIFSQTNIAIANSLLTANSAQGKTPNTQIQNTALTLIQQAINVARAGTTISPVNTLDWQNLAGIYRALIGFGQNAESFTIASLQQAILLDPANPQEYINLGGVYYQIGQYDNAIRQFQTAINLKPDLANAYYNLGHAYEAKQDFTNALANYQAVKTLVANDKTNLDKINAEIDALQKKMGTTEKTQNPLGQNTQPAANQETLSVPQVTPQFPQQEQQVPLPGPISPTKSPSPTPHQ